MKTYVLTVSRKFPGTHNRREDPTYFVEQIQNALAHYKDGWPTSGFKMKFHTIRANYALWKKRFRKIDAGLACLSIRYWSGKPYKSKQIEFARLTKEDGIGLQKCFVRTFNVGGILIPHKDYSVNSYEVAKNDGLEFDDFKEWFKSYDLNKPMAIIHFTKFRY